MIATSKNVAMNHQSSLEWIATRVAPFAGMAAVGYAYSYILGYSYLWEFFRVIGAPWVVDLMDATTIARVPSIAAVFGLIAVSVFLFPWTPIPDADLAQVVSWAVLSVILYVIHYIVEYLMPAYRSHWIVAAYVSTGFTVFSIACNLIHRSREKMGAKQGASFIALLFSATIFLVAPVLADLRASSIKDSGATTLPKVLIQGEAKENYWHLLRPTSGNQVVIARKSAAGKLEFRVVETTSIAIFHELEPVAADIRKGRL